MDAASEQKTFGQKVQEKVAQSRFFTFSLLLHVVIVIVGGSAVLFHKAIDAPDFTSEGGDLMSAEANVQPPMEQPPDMTEQQTVTPEAPTITAPTVSALVTNSTNNTSFQMANIPVPVKIVTGESKLSDTSKAISNKMGKGLPGAMAGRAGGAARAMAMKDKGGKDKSEKAVLAGLRWLKGKQKADGSWSTDMAPAMTGLALLCFLGHGELPESPEFGETVKKSLDWLLAKGTEFQGRMSLTKDGFGNQPAVYQHAIATYAMGEYYSMTKDERFAPLLGQAVKYIVEGQNPLGGWDYEYKKSPRNDLSVAGWQIQALKAAHLTGLNLPGVDESLEKSMEYIKKWQGKGGGFGYDKPPSSPGDERLGLTGIGVLCTLFWKESKDRTVKDGIDFILSKGWVQYEGREVTDDKGKKVRENADIYGWYYATQACLMFGGSAWGKWNRMFQEEITDHQGADGSWPPTAGSHGQQLPDSYGPYYRTTLCILMLEVFYRYMPTNK